MKLNNSEQRICVYCRNYQLLGRKSGNCQKLGVAVEGRWQACPLYVAPFRELSKEMEMEMEMV